MKTALIINSQAGRSSSFQIKQISFIQSTELEIFDSAHSPWDELPDWLQTRLDNGVRRILSASGDGGLHHLVNLLLGLLRHRGISPETLVVGAIGIGSSNDFHKPFAPDAPKPPRRTDFTDATLSDLGKVEFLDENHRWQTRYFLISFSAGLTAQGNHVYNMAPRDIRCLKAIHPSLAIGWTSIRALLLHRNQNLKLRLGDDRLRVALTNLNIIKKPYFAGGLHFRAAPTSDDGRLALYAYHGLNRFSALLHMKDLLTGKFRASEHSLFRWITSATLEAENNATFIFEVDGETFRTSVAKISIEPRRIQLCR